MCVETKLLCVCFWAAAVCGRFSLPAPVAPPPKLPLSSHQTPTPDSVCALHMLE